MFYTASKYFVVVLCVLLCSGCLLDRLVGSKRNYAPDRIELGEVTEEGASIIFIKPILWNSDIIKIIGEKPTRIIPEFITPQSKKLEYHYRIVREGDDPQGEYSFNTVFHFEKKENIFKLARVDRGGPRKLDSMLSESFALKWTRFYKERDMSKSRRKHSVGSRIKLTDIS